MSINVTLTSPPSPAPNRRTQSASVFSDAVDARLSWDTDRTEDLNNLSSQINSTAVEINTKATNATDAANVCLATTNFIGLWSAQTGSHTIPTSVYHEISGTTNFWALVTNTTDITADVPGTSSKWKEITLFSDFGGGADSNDDTTDVTLTTSMKRLQYRSQSASGRFYTLPSGSYFGEGIGVLSFYNSGNYPYGIKDADGTFICRVSPGKKTTLDLIDKTGGSEVWGVREDGDLFMNHLKSIITSYSVSYFCSDKLSDTEILAAWVMNSAVYAGVFVLTSSGYDFYGSAIDTPLQVTSESGTYPSVCTVKEMSTTAQALLCFRGSDAYGNAQMLEWNGSTLSTKGSEFEFLSSAYCGSTACVAFSETKIHIAYVNTSSNYIYRLVLDWTDPTLSVGTAAVLLSSSYTTSYIDICKLSGSSTSGTAIISSRLAAANYQKRVWSSEWTGSAFTTTDTEYLYGSGDSPYRLTLVALDSNYLVGFTGTTTSNTYPSRNELTSTLFYWDGSTIEKQKTIILTSDSYFMAEGCDAYLSEDGVVCVSVITGHSSENKPVKTFKIKAVGATSPDDCVLEVLSETYLTPSNNSQYMTFRGFDSKNAIMLRSDAFENSSYMIAEKVEVG